MRGVLALIVFFHHFIYCFASPFITAGATPAESSSPQWNVYQVFTLTPLNLFFNPGMAIYFFFVISGFVLSFACLKSTEVSIVQQNALKRYVRLAIPVLASCLLLWFFHRAGLIYRKSIPVTDINRNWLPGLLPDNLNFIETVKYGLFSVFSGNSRYNPVLWTMHVELLCSFIVFLFLFITHKMSLNKSMLILIVALPLTFAIGKTRFAAFILGMIICFLYCKSDSFNKKTRSSFFKILFLISGLYFASYPFVTLPEVLNNSIYKWIYYPDSKESQDMFYALGVSLLFIVFLSSNTMYWLFNLRPFQFLGKISFMLYLIHLPLIFVFSSRIYEWLYKYVLDYANIPITLVLTMILMFIISYLLYYVVDRKAIKWSRKLATFFLRA